MAINYTVEKHAEAYISKMLAQNGGKHIYNILIANNHDNGDVVAKGSFVELDLYGEKASTGVAAVVLGQAPNGNWYVEITNAGDGLILHNAPVIYEESPRRLTDFDNFYNEKGDTVRGYEMAVGDVVELSAKAFDGTPAAGKALSISSYKWKVATAPTQGGTTETH